MWDGYIIFEGDFVRLHGANDYFRVTDIVDNYNVKLDNGFTVEATDKYIATVQSEQEFLDDGGKIPGVEGTDGK